MILTCPSCGTQYVVKDGAIPPGGRQVRCASCKHSWHEDAQVDEASAETPAAPVDETSAAQPDYSSLPAETDSAATAAEDDGDESFAEAALIEPSTGPAIEERAYEETLMEDGPDESGPGPAEPAVEHAPPTTHSAPAQVEPQDDEFSPFSAAAEDVEATRRSPLVTILIVVILVAAIAAAFWFFAPDAWKVRLGLAAAGASPLALVTTHMDRQRLASGQETLNVTGRVINNTGQEQDVPPLQAQLRSRAGKLVYKWTIAPPAATLPPGGSASFNSTEVSVPPGGDELTISVGAPNA